MNKGYIVLTLLLALTGSAGAVPADTDACSDAVKQGKFSEAIAACTKKIEDGHGENTIANAYRNRGIAYLASGQPDPAIADFTEALKLSPKDGQTYNDRGVAYLTKGKFDLAIDDFNRSIQLNPTSDEPYRNRGAVYMAAGKFDAAKADFTKAIELDTDDSRGYYNMACWFSLQKNTTESCSWLQKAVSHGYKNWEHIKQDSDLENVRRAECYQDIMKGK